MQKDCKIPSIDWDSFPVYFAYGFADQQSRRIEDEWYIMDYLMDGKKCMEIRLSNDAAEIIDCWEGKNLYRTHYPDLDQSLEIHFSLKDQVTSPIHDAWVKTVCNSANIYVEFLHLKQVEQLYYPDVFLVDLFIPIKTDDQIRLEAIQSNPMIKVFNMKKISSVIAWKNRQNGTAHSQKIILLCITVPLAFVFPIVRSISHLINKEKMWRAFSMLHSEKENRSIKVFFGSENDNYERYLVLI